MHKKIGLIFFIILFFTPLIQAFDGDISNLDQTRSAEELSPKLEAPNSQIPTQIPEDIAEALYLIQELEREITLTNELLGIRDERKSLETQEETISVQPDIKEEKPIEPQVTEADQPQEVKLAKQISQDPAKSLPRKDRSRIRTPSTRKDLIRRFKPL